MCHRVRKLQTLEYREFSHGRQFIILHRYCLYLVSQERGMSYSLMRDSAHYHYHNITISYDWASSQSQMFSNFILKAIVEPQKLTSVWSLHFSVWALGLGDLWSTGANMVGWLSQWPWWDSNLIVEPQLRYIWSSNQIEIYWLMLNDESWNWTSAYTVCY